ncbi:MAG: NAD-dependent epimerase/dehydratase family protein [Alphaproteobacteria bacterium]|nr:NAD-dependent epimerase/dehydratase family protein [Alphaproteobacteria bacterium]
MAVLLTGAAGFIGYHVAEALLARGEEVMGVDNLNAYYDPRLKEARLARLASHTGFRFRRLDIADRATVAALAGEAGIDRIVHLAAQAGVRHSFTDPLAYVTANLVGHAHMMEVARALQPRLKHFVYASSSSVYGGNTKLPFSVEDRVDQPISLYAATKRSDELLTFAYAEMFGLKATGLRYFTVYGPWGRPDMSAYIFTGKILRDEPISVFNKGEMRRDFTYIDDIVAGTLAALDHPPLGAGTPHRVYNLGNHNPVPLAKFIAVIEAAVGRKAKLELEPLPPGDVKETFADIAASERDLGFAPRTTIEQGIPNFVAWYREYHQL